MSRLSDLFKKKNKGVINIYCTAGYPTLHSTTPIMHALAENGADIIEVGMPYSDPLADGPVIQQSSLVALQNGINIELIFAQIKEFRNQWPHLPVVLMGYLNPVMQYGFEKFCEDCGRAGVDGLIIPDIPAHIYEKDFKSVIDRVGLDFIFLVTPETSDDRMQYLDSLSSGFLYAVSSSSTTGSKSDEANESYLSRLRDTKLNNPVLVGFGIQGRAGFMRVSSYVNGAIIGSAFLKRLDTRKSPESCVKQFMKELLET